MDGAPRVAAVVRPLATLDGVTVLLISVEFWPDSITVRVAGLPNEHTQVVVRPSGVPSEAGVSAAIPVRS